MAEPYSKDNLVDRVMPRVGVPEALRRHKFLAVLPVILMVGLAIGYGLSRPPIYEAESRQTIGRIDVNQPGALAAFKNATEGLASSYSRAIDATSVTKRVARRTDLPESVVRSRLSASPVPESPIFVVRATGTSADEAIRLSREGSAALRAYVIDLNTRNPNAGRVLRRVRATSLAEAEQRAEVRAARRDGGNQPTPEQRQRIADAEARLDSAVVASEVASENYRNTQLSQGNVSLVQSLTEADSASNDRFQRLQIAVFVGLVLGVLMGIALATLRANQEVRRALSVN